jgi:uncharacterized secreted protein with C-terminal beta-propeller domain
MKPYLWRVLGMAALSLGCNSTPQPTGNKPPAIAQDKAALVAFQSCDELESYVKDTAVQMMKETVESSSYWRYPMAEDGAKGSVNAGAAAPAHSDTNTQVAGVDEGDFVKTDGNRVFYLNGGRLYVLKSWPAEKTAIETYREIEGTPSEMFLSDNKLVVFSQVWDPILSPGTHDYYYNWYGASATKVSVFDVTTNEPVLVNEYYLGGYYNTSRRIDSAVRMVMWASLTWPELQYWIANPHYDHPELDRAAFDQLEAQNEVKIRAQPLSQWLPRSYVLAHGQYVESPLQCTHYVRPTVPTKLGLTMVATLDLAHPENGIDQTGLLAETGTVYSSLDSLYMATPIWWWGWWGRLDGQTADWDRTYLHKFSLAKPDRVEYRASGVVPGHILNQFSMDEHKGFLRTATSTWPVWDYKTGKQVGQQQNRVYVLKESGGLLETVGKTGDLAPGESIYGARFFEEKGFLVTYRQIDPLFTLDLSDPTNPHAVGALHIPGVSTYIHLLDPTHLLTVGQDSVTTATGELRNGVALQLFDVGDMANPKLTAKVVVGTRWGYSEALWDHKAFNYFAKTGVLAIPFTDYSTSGDLDYWFHFQSKLKAFKIDAAGAITPIGEVDHGEYYQRYGYNDWYWWYEPYIRRSVQIEDFVYSFSSAAVKVNPIADLTKTTASIPLPPQRTGR